MLRAPPDVSPEGRYPLAQCDALGQMENTRESQELVW